MDSTPETKLLIAEAMAGELTDYLLGGNLYRQMIVKTPEGVKQPKMTLGSLLETSDDLAWQRSRLDSAQRGRLSQVVAQIETAQRTFPDAWRALLQREAKALLGSWRWYLDDIARNPEARETYASETRQRTRLELVMQALADAPLADERRELAELDVRLRGLLTPSDYAGPHGEQARYPRDRAWWLYGKPAPPP